MKEQKNLIKKLDKVCGDIIRKTKYCKVCGIITIPDPAHIFGRKCLSVRWELENIVPLCHEHHLKAHKNQKAFKDYMKRVYGEEKFQKLELRANTAKHWTIEELKELYIILDEKLKTL
jgi:hypothetical protein